VDPIVAANLNQHPRNSGQAALYFDPADPVDIADKIYRLLDRPEEAQERTAIGRSLSREFSYYRTAEETLKILEDGLPHSGYPEPEGKGARSPVAKRFC